jgi:SAM-dependent methyltransferase
MIDIGGGTIPASGCINLDIHHGEGEWRRRIQDGIPMADNSVVACRASHVMEHIPAGEERLFVMNEVHRVLVPGGTFEIIVPCVGVNGKLVEGWWPYADPTHVSFWYFPESWLYFCEGPFKPNADYGMKIWAALRDEDMRVEGGWEAHVIMRKP